MSAYIDLDQCAADALELCALVRQRDPKRMYSHLAIQCYRDPERMAQIMMALAAFVDPETSTTGALRRILDAAVAGRRQGAPRVVMSR
ncbi:hypothetical protein C5E45_32825 [Nocardia nova]|uniref:Uncharacterized protein n=1 Tax=Nocardia nova TaxID=37330 RepID=A0A2S6ACR6_9NOCA|nr:hypothetical protein [Nocardia nova]PPJ31876.1 hypothetical protein C5E45_32825 [Nocardia nova]